MPRSCQRDAAEFLAKFAPAMAAWDVDTMVTLLWDQFGVAAIWYFAHRLPPEEEHQAEDLAQDLFLTLLGELQRFQLRGYPELCGWIWWHAHKVFSGWMRKHNAKMRDPARLARDADLDALLGHLAGPDANLRRDELWDQIVARLTTQEHAVLVLLLEGLSPQQIADRLKITVNAVYIHISRIRAKITCLLEQGGERSEP
jgi:RNA polymerase sigma factor (sigma-70 family)